MTIQPLSQEWLAPIIAPVIEELAETPDEVLDVLATALSIAGGDEQLCRLGDVLHYCVGGVSPLSELQLRMWLRKNAVSDEGAVLVERLRDADGPLWAAIRAALERVRADLADRKDEQ